VTAWVLGLGLARSDLFDPFVSLFILSVVSIGFLYLKKKAALLLLVTGGLWGAADLMFDARAVAVGESWLSNTESVRSTIERVEKYDGYSRLLVTDLVRSDGETSRGKALLYSYGKQQYQLHAGQNIEASVSWRLPRNYLNPGSFDYQAWCFDQGIALIGSIRGNVQILSDFSSWLDQVRRRVRAAVVEVDSRAAGVLHAVLLGDRSQIDTDVNRSFSATGAAHLLAISGMHVGMVASCMFVLLWWCLTRRESWMVSLPVRKLAMAGGFLAAVAYAVIAGLPLPAQRALFMLAAAVLAWLLASRMQPMNTLLAALAVILLFDPSAVVSLSLWLSFVATVAILLWAINANRKDRGESAAKRFLAAVRILLWVSLIASLATLPLIVSTFGRIPVYSLPANLVLVPLYGLFVLPLALLGEVSAILGLQVVASTLMDLSGRAVELGITSLEWLVALPSGELWAVAPSLWLGLLYFAGLAVSGRLWLKGLYQRAGVAVLIVLMFYLTAVLSENDIQKATWIVWDVGQGASSTLLLPDNEVLVVDVPGRRGSRFNGGTTVAAGLRHLGLTHVNRLILSHAQSDHLGGAISLMQSMNRVDELWLPDVPSAYEKDSVKAIIAYAKDSGITIKWLAKGDHVAGDGYDISILWPPRGHVASNKNNTSLVLQVEVGGKSLLWPGDIEIPAESAMLADGLEAVDMMLMPHHGSRTSSHAAFVKALSPGLVVAQTGFTNRYGFPNKQVVKTYQMTGSAVKNSREGAVVVDLASTDFESGLLQWRAGSGSRRDMARQWWEIRAY